MNKKRNNLTPQDMIAMKEIARNLNRLLNQNNITRTDLAKAINIPLSTLSGYTLGTSLPIAGNVQKIADYFGLKKSDIDPRFLTTNNFFSNNEINSNNKHSNLNNTSNSNNVTNNYYQDNKDCECEISTDTFNKIVSNITKLNKEELKDLTNIINILLKAK